MTALITCGQTRQALSATRALGRAAISVAICSTKKPFLAMYSRYASSVFVTKDPTTNPYGFALEIAEELKGRCAPCALVSTDDAWWALSKFRDLFPASMKAILPPHISVVRALDHEALQHFALSLSIPCAPIMRFSEEFNFLEIEKKIKNIKFPILMRPIIPWIEREDGIRRFNKKFIAKDKDHLFYILKNNRHFLETGFLLCIYQTKKSKAIFGVADNGNILISSFQERLFEEEPLNEVATVARTIKPIAQIKDYAKILLKALNWQGPFKIEFIEDKKRGFLLVSIIGRLWASMELSVRANLNIPLVIYELSKGHVDPKLLKNALPNMELRWLLGDSMAKINYIKNFLNNPKNIYSINFNDFNFKQLISYFKVKRVFDVLDINDPLPFIFEVKKFFKNH